MQPQGWSRRTRQSTLMIAALALVAGLVGVASHWTGPIRRWDRDLLGTVARDGNVFRRAASIPSKARSLMRPLAPGLVLGYLYDPKATAQALDQLRQLVPVVTGIAADWYSVSSSGELTGQTQPQVMEFAQAHHLTTLAVIEQTDPSVLNALIQDPVAEAISQNEMLTMVESDGFDGVNLDWEGIPAGDRNLFSRYVGELVRLFHQHGFYVTLSVPPETSNQPQDSWTGAYNYRVLGREADLLMIMAYDQHWAGGPPGPIASTSWVRSVLAFSVSQVAPDKVILGIPGYGYDWSGEGAVALTFAQAQQLEQAYAPKSNANHFQYVQGGVLHSVWFENTQSFLGSVQLVTGFELRGIVLWRIGIEDPKIWDFLE
ncbi:MAG: glycosyl hydrolase family 18 protein [Firmicutes bacterium]|nr:glycosyl hydrolase family 18 protein [Bacillota bacterium]